jgi:predicted enzyme related to lactoylglutathione lyase
MTNRHGTPIWYELMTDDPDAAQKFYGAIMAWTFEKMPGDPSMDYRIASAGKETVAGISKTPQHATGMPSTWFVYVGVDDVDASAAKVKTLGGKIDIEPTDIPGVGRFAFCTDPQGAHFYLMRGNSDKDSTAFTPMRPGHCCWNELVTSDQKAALEFYRKLFGWEHGGAMPMGPAGDYTFINHDGGIIGAVMDLQEKDAKPFWNFAMQVADIDDAKAAVENASGSVRMGPHALPDNSGWLIQADDPQGAKIMFVGSRKETV